MSCYSEFYLYALDIVFIIGQHISDFIYERRSCTYLISRIAQNIITDVCQSTQMLL